MPSITAPAGYVYRTITAAKMAARGFRAVTITAETLFASLPADGSVEVRWSGFGHVHGREMFGTHLMRRSDDGARVEVLRTVAGMPDRLETILGHPLGAGRTVRTFAHDRR